MSSAVGVQIRDSSGVVVMDLTVGNGWDKVVFDDDGDTWAYDTVTSAYVDGKFPGSPPRKDSQTLTVTLLALGSSIAEVDGLVQDLKSVVASSNWQITRALSGVSATWRVLFPANSSVSFTTDDWLLNRRTVTLTITAQPNPAITGTV